MFDLEPEYVEGLSLIAFWHRCSVEEVVGRVAVRNPPDLGIALRWFIWDFFVNHRHFDRTPEKRWHLDATHHWHKKFHASPTPTRHQVLDFRKTTHKAK